MPKYSIIVPVYNCIDYLPACVDSILSQTANDFELLLIDDGAADGSGVLCDEFAKSNSQIKAFHKTNGGAASARNVGIEKACGDYLLFIDSDDTIAENTLKLIDKAVAETDMVIFGMAFDYYNKSGELERTDNLSCKHEGIYETAEVLKSFKAFFEDNALSSACNKCFRADVVRENGLRFIEGMTLYEDMEFVLRYLENTKKVSCIGQALYHYRLHTDDNHLHKLVYTVDGLTANMNILIATVLSLKSKHSEADEMLNTAGNLYMRLLSLHFFLHKYGKKAVKRVVNEISENDMFRKLFSGNMELGNDEQSLAELISRCKYMRISLRYRKRRVISKAKKLIKAVLKKLHLYKS